MYMQCTYLKFNLEKYLDITKIEYRAFQGAEPPKLHFDCVITKHNKCNNVLAYYGTLNVLLNI